MCTSICLKSSSIYYICMRVCASLFVQQYFVSISQLNLILGHLYDKCKLVQLECCIYQFYTVYACLLCENVCVLLQQILCVCPKWLARSWPQSPDLYSNLNRSLLQLTFLLNINYSPRQSRIKMVISQSDRSCILPPPGHRFPPIPSSQRTHTSPI